MGRNFTVLFAGMLFLSSTTGAQAALIANGDFTTDTGTGLDWLDLDLSLGLSVNQVSAQLGTGGLFEGYQIAIFSQVQTFLTNAGWGGPFDPTNMMNVGFVASFKSQTTSYTNDPVDDINGFTDDWAGDLGILSLTDAAGSGITSFSISGLVNPNFSDQNAGTFLVRTTVVPLPAAFWLFGAGLSFLYGCARHNMFHR